ncbi:MAG: ribosome maturation factor RimP [Clostridia bacterium]|nr:ribosome maturation factor RimP [Clostridia bacterium]
MAVKDVVQQLLEEKVAAMGYELIEVTYQKQYGSMTLTLFIDTDKEGGISLDDCEAVSRMADPVLDEADVTDGAAYTLNVSSPGLDRPIKTERDFRKKAGSKVEASLYVAQNGSKKIVGVLSAWDEETVTLTVAGKSIILKKKDVAVLKPVIEF